MPWTNGDLAIAATAVIALVALVRPDLDRILRRSLSLIQVHPAGRLEVGFSTFGPTVGFQGTLQAIHDDQFISSSQITVERLADHSRHNFEWAVFRPPSLALAPSAQTFEIAAGFLLSVDVPRRFNVQFHDSTTADRFRQSVIEVQRLWLRHLQSQEVLLADVPPGQVRALYNAFHQAHLSEISPHFQIIDREFYWTQGSYRITVSIKTSRPSKTATFDYKFSLSDEESRTLRLNAVACLSAACNVPDVIFNFAYPVYLQP